MSTFIAGGCGFIGLNITEAVLARGDDAVLFDLNPLHPAAARAFAALPGRLTVLKGDVGDAAAIEAARAPTNVPTMRNSVSSIASPQSAATTPTRKSPSRPIVSSTLSAKLRASRRWVRVPSLHFAASVTLLHLSEQLRIADCGLRNPRRCFPITTTTRAKTSNRWETFQNNTRPPRL